MNPAATLHQLRLIAAHILVARWVDGLARFVVLAKGRLEPHPVDPKRGAVWPIGAPEVERILVATVCGGARYQGWGQAMTTAMQAATEKV